MGEHMVVLDAGMRLTQSTELSGWLLQQPPSTEFDALAPPDRRAWVWDKGTRSGRCCVLRRPDPRVVVPTGLRLPRGMAEDLTLTELPLECWQPLLLLNLNTSLDGVQWVAEYDVVPGEYVQRSRGAGPVLVASSFDDDLEEPLLGPLRLNADDTTELLRWLAILDECFPTTDRFARGARQYLDAGPMLAGGGDVTRPSDRGKVLLQYVKALELLLSDPDERNRRSLVSRRTQTLLAAATEPANIVYNDVMAAYQARNFEAHGGGPPVDVAPDLPIRMRDHVRRVICRLLVLGPDFDAPRICQDAIQDPNLHRRQILQPVEASLHRVHPAQPGRLKPESNSHPIG